MIYDIKDYFTYFDESGQLLLGELNSKFNILEIEPYIYTGLLNSSPFVVYSNDTVYLGSQMDFADGGTTPATSVGVGIILYNELNVVHFQRTKNCTVTWNTSTNHIKVAINHLMIKNFWFSRMTNAGTIPDYVNFIGIKIIIEP